MNKREKAKLQYEGSIFKSDNYGDVLVVNYIDSQRVLVRFLNTGYEGYFPISQVKSGCIKDKSIPIKYLGIGILDADYQIVKYEKVEGVVKNKSVCPYYSKWHSMLSRCYSSSSLKRNPTYKGCVVHKDWLTFSNFKSWMEKQDWVGKVLDKDILGDGTIYSEDTCTFIPSRVNNFVCEGGATRGEYMLGVHKYNNHIAAYCRDPFTDKPVKLKILNEGEELLGHNLWKFYKRLLVVRMLYTGILKRGEVYDKLYNYYDPEMCHLLLWKLVQPVAEKQGVVGDLKRFLIKEMVLTEN